jgi:hypothetical protein
MPHAILPVKRPESDPGLIPRRQCVAFRLQENKRQKSAAGFGMETKNTIVIPTPKKIFCRVQIQDLIVDVISDASAKKCPRHRKSFLNYAHDGLTADRGAGGDC